MTYIYYFYLIASAALVPLLDNFFPILRQAYSWWLVPVLLIGFFLMFVIIQLLVIVITIITTNTEKPVSLGRTRNFRFQVRILLPLLLTCVGVKVDYEERKPVPSDKHYLLVCNHQHDLDPVAMLYCLFESKIAFIGKKDIYTEMKFIAKAMHLLQSLPIDRENDREAAKTIIKATKLIKDDIASVMLFPEGYTNRTPENGLLPFRNGAFKIAMKANAPIVVSVIDNTRSITKNMFRRKTIVTYKVLDVLYPEDYAEMNTSQIGDLIHEKMEKELAIIRNK